MRRPPEAGDGPGFQPARGGRHGNRRNLQGTRYHADQLLGAAASGTSVHAAVPGDERLCESGCRMKWILKCRDATELASRAMDERLPLTNRMALRLHLAICDNCARFNRQLQEMRRLFREEPATGNHAGGLTTEARQRIATELQNRLDT